MSKIKIIAEIAWGHDGSLKKAMSLLIKSKEAGADIFSFHITSLTDYMVPYYGSGKGKVSEGRESLDLFKYLQSINLSNEDWLKLIEEARKIKMPLCIMPNDMPSLEFAENFIQPEYYVLPPACFIEENFLIHAAKFKRPTLFRIGGATLGEIENAINIFRKEGNEQIVLLHGFQNYPTKLEETNLEFLITLKEAFNLDVGLADHIDGGSDLAMIVPVIAIACKATYIEKHITLDRNEKSEDFESALDPENFKRMVNYIHAAEIALGNKSVTELSMSTQNYRRITRKRIVAATQIKEGDRISLSNIAFKRCDVGLTIDQLNAVTGRTAARDFMIDDAITLENVR